MLSFHIHLCGWNLSEYDQLRPQLRLNMGVRMCWRLDRGDFNCFGTCVYQWMTELRFGWLEYIFCNLLPSAQSQIYVWNRNAKCLGRVIIQNKPFWQGHMGTAFPYCHIRTNTTFPCSHKSISEQKLIWTPFPYKYMGTCKITAAEFIRVLQNKWCLCQSRYW